MRASGQPLVLTVMLGLVVAGPASSQILFDGTLRPGNAGLPPSSPVPCSVPASQVIDEADGLSNGTHLFHSFSEFNVPADERVCFTGSSSLDYVFSRVTGNNASTIAGTLRSDIPNADFYLFNPHGITFVQDGADSQSKIEMPGSFFASTASSLFFDELGDAFTVAATETPAELLSITSSPSAWGFLPGPSGEIVTDQLLRVTDGETLSLVGRRVRTPFSSQLVAIGGEIQLAAVGDAETTVPLALENFSASGLGAEAEILIQSEARLQGGTQFGDTPKGRIVLRGGRLEVESSTLEAGGNGGSAEPAIDIQVAGEMLVYDTTTDSNIRSVSSRASGTGGIRLEAGRLEVTGEGSQIYVSATNGGAGGDIEILVDEVVLRDRASIYGRGRGGADGAGVRIDATTRVEVQDGATIETLALQSEAGTRGGDVRIVTRDLVVGSSTPGADGGVIRSETSGPGAGGHIVVDAASVELLDGGRIEVFAEGAGRGGDVTLDATDGVRISGEANGLRSGIVAEATVDASAVASAGEAAPRILVDAPVLELSNGAVVNAITRGAADGHDIQVDGAEISLRDGSQLNALTFGSGTGGDIAIVNARSLLAEGAEGDAASGLFARPELASAGEGGGISIEVGALTLLSGGQVDASTRGAGTGGAVAVTVHGDIRIDGAAAGETRAVPSGIFARSGIEPTDGATGDGGSLSIDGHTLDMSGASVISARTFGVGDAGTLRIRTDENVTLNGDATGAPEISTRAFDGNGGGVGRDEPGLRIETGRLELSGGAAVASSTSGLGQAGDIEVVASSVSIAGASTSGQTSAILAEAAATPGAPAGGDSGRIDLIVGRLEVGPGGEISIETSGPGSSQAIDVQASTSIEISGGAIRSSAEVGSSGRAGDIELDASDTIAVVDGGRVTAESFGDGDAGSIRLTAGELVSVVGGHVTTEATTAAGGNIELVSPGQVEMVGGRVITSVIGRDGEGDAGNISVVGRSPDPSAGDPGAPAGAVVVNASEVLAQATRGDGGDIWIAAGVYLESADSNVDASSDEGISGQITVNAPVVNLNDALARLPDDFRRSQALLREHCAARVQGLGSFVVEGREATEELPDAPLAAPLRLPEADAEDRPPAHESDELTEAPLLRLTASACRAILASDQAVSR
jgi:filamentous hemagglutinin family protein